MGTDKEALQSSTSHSETSRRSYLKLLSALGVSSGIAGAHSNEVKGIGKGVEQQNGPAKKHGITVTDSGSSVGESVSHLDFDGALSAVEADDGSSVQIHTDNQVQSNPNVVNIRDDLDVEPESDDVWAAIHEHYASFEPTDRNHTYVIPPGTWFVQTDNIHLDAHEYFGLVGEPFATLRVNDQDVDRLMTVGTIDESLPHAQRTMMRDLRVDIRGEYDAGICRWYTYTYGHIENLEMRGTRNRRHPDYGGDRHTIMVDGVRPMTTNVIRGCHLNNRDTNYDTSTSVGHAIGYSSEINNKGTNIWEACQVTGYTDNGIYVSSNSGRNIIIGCLARNCAGASIRIGANDMVLNSAITMDEQPGHSWSGLWLDNGGGQVVERLHVNNEIEKSTEIVRCTHDGPARLSNVHIQDEGGDGRVVRVNDDDATQTVFESCSITGRASPTISDYGIYVRSSNVVFRDCQFDFSSQSDSARNGIYVDRDGTDVDRLVLDNCSVDADVASLRFSDGGEAHDIESSSFGSLVMSDPDAPLSNVLWVGNHHNGDTNFRGERSKWQGDFNWGFEL